VLRTLESDGLVQRVHGVGTFVTRTETTLTSRFDLDLGVTEAVVAARQILVALVLAGLAGRLPLSGYTFQWTSRLASSHHGWFVGWAGLMAFIPGFTGLDLGLAPILSERLGLSLSETSILVVVVVLTLTQFLINLAGVTCSRTRWAAAGPWCSNGWP
jgi:hypothetical protein